MLLLKAQDLQSIDFIRMLFEWFKVEYQTVKFELGQCTVRRIEHIKCLHSLWNVIEMHNNASISLHTDECSNFELESRTAICGGC